MRYPKNLPVGGTIGFPAPSFGCATQPYKAAFEHALEKWESMGYKTLPGPNALVELGVGISNAPDKCAQEFMEMYLSD